MPEIKVKSIASFSSEDKIYKAENLLKPETYRKWKCATPGEKSASVLIQLEKASEIHSIDIGNESSAFVEVFVGRSSSSLDDYQVLLVSSSFMSPLESRNCNNVNRVRMFGPEKLAQNTKNEKWDSVHVVCTQPFNKQIQYGLTFIKFHSPPDTNDPTNKPELKLGAFRLKEDDDEDVSSLPVGSWFKKRNEVPATVVSATSPAAIRQASTLTGALSSPSPKAAPSPGSGIKRKISDELDRPVKKDPTSGVANQGKNRGAGSPSSAMNSPAVPKVPVRQLPAESSKNKTPSTKTVKVKKKKPFNELMKGVVFTLSGFQNPLRSDIRDKALQMGAKYKGDWDSACTHLVCAFINTPKYLQVQGAGGRIVKKEWIFDSHSRREPLPWRKYMMGNYTNPITSDEESSEEEIQHIGGAAQTSAATSSSASKLPAIRSTKIGKAKPEASTSVPASSSKGKTSIRMLNSVENVDSENSSAKSDYEALTEPESDGGNTEDELEKAQAVSPKKLKKTANKSDVLHTSVNGNILKSDSGIMQKPDTKDLSLPELPDLFKKKHFFFYGDFDDDVKHELERYIIAYNGYIEDYMSDTVKYVITNYKWNENFDDALSENDNLIFVRSQWLRKCDELGKFVPFQPYIVVPEHS